MSKLSKQTKFTKEKLSHKADQQQTVVTEVRRVMK
jgi:hypothetical protein